MAPILLLLLAPLLLAGCASFKPKLFAGEKPHFDPVAWFTGWTHGLAILGRLRGYLPKAQSLLMDESTLLAHRTLWVSEPTPHGATRVEHLDDAEQALYRDLHADRWGVRMRLEQERIGWDHTWTQIERAL